MDASSIPSCVQSEKRFRKQQGTEDAGRKEEVRTMLPSVVLVHPHFM